MPPPNAGGAGGGKPKRSTPVRLGRSAKGPVSPGRSLGARLGGALLRDPSITRGEGERGAIQESIQTPKPRRVRGRRGRPERALLGDVQSGDWGL